MEEIVGYKITETISVGSTVFTLGELNGNYATWQDHNGGHYFDDYKQAHNDMWKRASEWCQNHIIKLEV